MKKFLLLGYLLLSCFAGRTQPGLNFDPALIPFYHGVACGDPTPASVIIWTRVTPPDMTTYTASGTYQVATDTAFAAIVKSGTFTTDSSKDFTVKIDVTGLSSGSVYYYRFKAMGKYSLVGRAKTVPVGAVSNLKFIIASCQNDEAGVFNAWAKIAERNDLDGIIFVGDYIYEYAAGVYGLHIPGRVNVPAGETYTLPTYRTRYSLYHLDKDMIRVNQQHTWITIWDDHEFADNSYDTGAVNHNPLTQGPWSVRKAIAKQVYFEWVPIRDNAKDTVHRIISYGNLCDLMMLDTRMEGRQRPPDHFDTPDTGILARNIMSSTQMNWITDNLKRSAAKWKVVANQVLFTNANLGFAAGALSGIPSPTNIDSIRAIEDMFVDSWRGYPRQRAQLLDSIKMNNINNVVFVTGDSHSSWSWDIPDTPVYYPLAAAFNIPQPHPYDPVTRSGYNSATQQGSWAVEFAGPSITSQNIGEIIGPALTTQFSAIINQPIAALGNANYNPNLRYADLYHHGYILLDLKADSIHADYYFMSRVDTPVFTQITGATLKTAYNSNFISQASGPAPQKTTQDIPAPLTPTSTTGIAAPVKKAVIFSAFPNPAGDYITIQAGFTNPGIIMVNAYDMTGKKVALLLPPKQVINGVYNLGLSLAAITASGNYLIEIAGADFKESFTVTVRK